MFKSTKWDLFDWVKPGDITLNDRVKHTILYTYPYFIENTINRVTYAAARMLVIAICAVLFSCAVNAYSANLLGIISAITFVALAVARYWTSRYANRHQKLIRDSFDMTISGKYTILLDGFLDSKYSDYSDALLLRNDGYVYWLPGSIHFDNGGISIHRLKWARNIRAFHVQRPLRSLIDGDIQQQLTEMMLTGEASEVEVRCYFFDILSRE